jgi:hypothetical protein
MQIESPLFFSKNEAVMYGQAYVRRNRAKAAQVGPKAQ